MTVNNNETNRDNGYEVSVADILRLSIARLAESSSSAYKCIISLAEAEFFEKHQTSGNLRTTADELITRALGSGDEDEG